MYQTKPMTYHQKKGKNTIGCFGSYYSVFRINPDVKRPYNMSTFAKKKQNPPRINNLTQNNSIYLWRENYSLLKLRKSFKKLN